MCYSEQLSEAMGYAEPHGWVLVGWKAVLRGEKSGKLYQLLHHHGSRQTYRPAELVRDQHGFHTAATRRGAIEAALKFGEENWDPRRETALHRIRDTWDEDVLSMKLRLTQILVPARAVGDGNHCHSMLMLRPGERATAEQIAACNRENARIERAAKRAEVTATRQAEAVARVRVRLQALVAGEEDPTIQQVEEVAHAAS